MLNIICFAESCAEWLNPSGVRATVPGMLWMVIAVASAFWLAVAATVGVLVGWAPLLSGALYAGAAAGLLVAWRIGRRIARA